MIHHADLFHAVVSLRREAEVRNDWLKKRIDTLLPAIMRREGIDAWIVSAREYAEDPVIMSLLPAEMMSARRRTILVFHAPAEGGFEAMAIANAGIGLDGYYRPVWDKRQTELASESQEACLRRVLEERNPKRIGINFSSTFAFADGLTYSEHAHLMEALGPGLSARTTSAEGVVIGWLETRLPEELAAATTNNRIAHALIAEAFSPRVVQPGVTRATDVAWWLRERTRSLGLSCWFQPSVSIQRQGADLGPMGSTPDAVILPGDMLHCDFGLHYLGLATDTQQNAYVRLPGETDAPAGMRAALAVANKQQDLLADEMITGRSGNEILAAALAAQERMGITGRIYTHPIGYHGHGAGPAIGRYDTQAPLPGTGDALLRDDTLFSFEMFIEQPLAEWGGQLLRVATEQIVAYSGGKVTYLGGRQEQLHLI